MGLVQVCPQADPPHQADQAPGKGEKALGQKLPPRTPEGREAVLGGREEASDPQPVTLPLRQGEQDTGTHLSQ